MNRDVEIVFLVVIFIPVKFERHGVEGVPGRNKK